MLQITKGPTLQEAQIPFAWVEVRYPDKESWDEAGFYAMVDEHLAALCERYRDYVRADVFGQNPYFRFFRKFKKTFPVMMQFELETHVLTGTHDVEQLLGPAELYLAQAKEPFVGLRGDLVHTYPGDLCARDEGGIIFSMIAGADARTCARQTSRHVFYPVFGVPGQDPAALRPMQERLAEYARILAPDAEVSCQTI